MLAGLADHVHHALRLVCAAKHAACVAWVVEVGLLDAAGVGAVPASHIDHAFLLVLAAVEAVRLPGKVAAGVLAAQLHRALPVPDVHVHHPRFLVLAAVLRMRRARVIEVGVLVAVGVLAQLVDHVHHAWLLVCAAEVPALLPLVVEVGPGLAAWVSAAALHAHHDGLSPPQKEGKLRERFAACGSGCLLAGSKPGHQQAIIE